MHEQLMNMHATDHTQQMSMGGEAHSGYTSHSNYDATAMAIEAANAQLAGHPSMQATEMVGSLGAGQHAPDLAPFYGFETPNARFDPANLDPSLHSGAAANMADSLMAPGVPPPQMNQNDHKAPGNRNTPPVTTTMRFSHELMIPVQYSDIRGGGKDSGPDDQGDLEDADGEGDPDNSHRIRVGDYGLPDPAAFNRLAVMGQGPNSGPPSEYDPENPQPTRRTRYSRPGQPVPPVAASTPSNRRTSARQAAAQAAAALTRGKRRRDEESGEDEVPSSPSASAPSPPWRSSKENVEELPQEPLDPEQFNHLDRTPMYMISSRTGRLPLPVPIPNLIKKSRGRRVPTTPTGLGSASSRKRVRKEDLEDEAGTGPDGASFGGDGPASAAPPAMLPEPDNMDPVVPPVPPPGEEVRGFRCSVPGCGKWFKRGEHLKRHVRSIHTNEKPHICPHPGCGKGFSRHDNLCQHMRVHKAAVHAKPRKSKGARRDDVDEDYEPGDPNQAGLQEGDAVDAEGTPVEEDGSVALPAQHQPGPNGEMAGPSSTPDTVPPNPGSDYQAAMLGSAPGSSGRRPRGKLADADLSIYKKTYTNVRRKAPDDV